MEEGEEYEEKGNYEQAIETYTTAIICWYGKYNKLEDNSSGFESERAEIDCCVFFSSPYYYQLYINRAKAYMEVKNFRYTTDL